MLRRYGTPTDERVVIGPKVGEDAAVIEFPDRYLVAKTDPITFATDEIGWYAVQVNANDIATRGAVPKWFQAAVLLPGGKTDEKLVENIFGQIARGCESLNVSLIGGHTEITHDLDRPVVVGSMLGEVEKTKLVSTSGAEPGDRIIITKGIVIEGTAIIAREKRSELERRGYETAFIEKCRDYLFDPGISVVRDALLANRFRVHAMHDPTEGGLAAGLFEIAHASRVGLRIEYEEIPVLEPSRTLCGEFGLDPLGTITSGTLLIVAHPADSREIVGLLRENSVSAAIIGEVTAEGTGLKIECGGRIDDLKVSATDEITKIFE